MMTTVKPSDILRKAASILNSDLRRSCFDRGGCCGAISRATEALISKQKERNAKAETFDVGAIASRYFESLFKPKKVLTVYWFGNQSNVSYLTPQTRFSKAVQEHRIMALLMTAEMAESVGE